MQMKPQPSFNTAVPESYVVLC